MPLMLLRFWREGIIALLVLACGAQELRVRGLKSDLQEARQQVRDEKAAHKLTIANVRAAAEKARADDAAHARRVERDQNIISEEVSRDYQEQLVDLRRRYDALRVRLGKTPADPSGAGAAAVPGLPGSSAGSDGAAGQDGLPAEDALIASEIALRLKALQLWMKGQLGVERDKASASDPKLKP
jgi:hypothetical protein